MQGRAFHEMRRLAECGKGGAFWRLKGVMGVCGRGSVIQGPKEQILSGKGKYCDRECEEWMI